MRYLLAVHVPIAGMSFLPLIFGWPLLLYPVHIVFLEFIIDPACSVVFEGERTEDDTMRRPPRDPRQRLFSLQMIGISLILGATTLAAVCLAYWWVVSTGVSDREARSFGFSAIVLGNLAIIHATRSRDYSIVKGLHFRNPALWWVTAGTLGALLVAIYARPVADIFRFAPLPAEHLFFAILTGVGGVAWYELYKVFRRRDGRHLT